MSFSSEWDVVSVHTVHCHVVHGALFVEAGPAKGYSNEGIKDKR